MAPDTSIRRAHAVWNRDMQFVATSGSNHAIVIDAPPADGGSESGPSNTELLLMALCGCTGMDVVSILNKKRVSFDDLEIHAEAEKSAEPPNRLTRIRITYRIRGEVPDRAMREAVELSQEKYCTISQTVKGVAEVSWDYEIEPG